MQWIFRCGMLSSMAACLCCDCHASKDRNHFTSEVAGTASTSEDDLITSKGAHSTITTTPSARTYYLSR